MSAWLQLKGIKRSFGAIHALKGVDLTVNPGEVIGLVGENGAGKSTLMKIMSGFDHGFSGEFLVDGKQADLGSPQNAQKYGIAIAQQELSLIRTLSIAENIFLGGNHGPKFATQAKLSSLSKAYLEEVGLDYLSPRTLISRLSVGERHLVEVARLIAHNPKVLILDEPTAALGEADSHRILEMVKRLKSQDKAVIYVSHRLDEIFKITDRCVVLRDGKSEAEVETSKLDTQSLVNLMLGRELSAMFPPCNFSHQEVRFKVENLWPDRVLEPVSFEIRKGEILGLAGQLGSGSGEILAYLAGSIQGRGGKLHDLQRNWSGLAKSCRQAIKLGIAYCSPDRKLDGLFLGRPIIENLSAPNLSSVSLSGILSQTKEWINAKEIATSFTIDQSRLSQEASVLSGGNQQKVALGKWLSIKPQLILVNEPTRGVDIGAKSEIYLTLRKMVDNGVCVVVASTDLLEISNLSDRVLTFYKGAMTGELKRDQVNSNNILELITQPKTAYLNGLNPNHSSQSNPTNPNQLEETA